jgi:uncharacterized integral membrane protein
MPEPERHSRIRPRLVFDAALVVVIVVFVIENTRQTKIRFLVPQVTAPLWTALFVAALLGALAGVLIARHRRADKDQA